MMHRLKDLRRRLSEVGMDAVLISHPMNRRYLSGFTGSAGHLFITQQDAFLATDFRYIEQSRKQAPDFQILQVSSEFAKWLPALVSQLGVERLGCESNDLTLTAYRQLVKAIRKLAPKTRPQLIPSHGLVELLRSRKAKHELQSIEAAATLADAAVEHAHAILKAGITEKELAWNLERFLRGGGSESLPFEIIVASGQNSALPHAQPTDRQIQPGEPVVIDLGARINGYCSDMTRTICLGEPSETFLAIYRIVRQAKLAALETIRPGMSGEVADSQSRKIITAAGFGEAFGHGLGHGVGLEAHEEPRLGPGSTDILLTGMVFTIEPGIYLEGWGGVRIEDMVSLGKSGPRCLTRAEELVI